MIPAMPIKERSASRDSDRPKTPPGGRVVALRMVLCWLGVVVLGAGMGLGFVSTSTLAIAAGLVLGLLLAAVAASVAIVVSGRVWLMFPVFVVTCLYIVSAAFTSVGYVAAHGTRYTATAVSSECRKVKGGSACTARLRRPDGTMLEDAVSVSGRMSAGQTVDVVEDPAGIVATHPADEMDPDALPVDTLLLGAAAVLLAGLFGLAAVLGVRRPVARSASGRKGRSGKASRRS